MASVYQIRINTNEKIYESINRELGILPTSTLYCWEYTIEENSIQFYQAVDVLLSLLEGKTNALKSIGVFIEDISMWYLYEYTDQCNMEFNSNELKRIGELGITLCISCWEKQ